ncbi:MAG: response regulator [Lachnospiraceae bacterium]|nr:response regulator [Lachnospiraceae bacterium]
MLKIFLAEDEYVVREGIKNNIDWAGHGYEFVGEASDGELALPMIQKLKPDIVITDIKMPFMDGLELSRLIKKEFPWMEVIILSGYAEFDYAKEAISIGVAHYLTKPISGDELISQLDELSSKIEANKQERELKEQYAREMAENSLRESAELFRHMALGDKSAGELMQLADKLNMDISAGAYNVVLFKAVSTHHEENEYSGSVVAIYERLSELADKTGALVFDRDIEGKAIVLRADDAEAIKKAEDDALEGIDALMSEYEYVNYYGGMGQAVVRLSELHDAYEKASHAYAHRYMSDESKIFRYEETLKYMDDSDPEDFNISSIAPGETDRSRVMEFLHKGTESETVYYVDEFFAGLGENALHSNMFRQYVATEVYFAVSAFMDERGYDRNEIRAFDMTSGDISDVDSTRRYIIEIIGKAIEIRDSQANNRYSGLIDELKAYIDEHYADEDLSLNVLASHVNFSPNHLSMIFSAQTGETFIKYLTDYRMNKAKELLRCTSKRSVEISVEVGYKDPHYFSYLFKKTQGMTPTQYRSGNMSAEEEDGV